MYTEVESDNCCSNNMDTEVESDRYLSWEDFLEGKTSHLSGYVSSLVQLEKLILEYEFTTSSRFRSLKSTKDFGQNIDLSSIKTLNVRFSDTQSNCDPAIPYDGAPFLILGKKILECHQGPNRDRKTNEKKFQQCKKNSDHTYKVSQRNYVQPSKKKGCPAKIKIRHVLKFPGYQLAENQNSKYIRNQVAAKLKEDLKYKNHDVLSEHRFYVSFPENDEHCNHLKGEASCILQPMDRRLSEYIKKIVMEHGVTSTLKMKLLLEVHLKEFIFKDTPLPPKYNKRFWPSLKDIYNHMGSQLLKLRDSCIDQQIIQEMVTKENSYHPDDKFYIRTKNEESESVIEEPDENLLLDEDFTIRRTGCRNKFLYVHQTKWQQELLRRYGNEICLLDATYRTTRYSLPLYFLCVPTNVNYMTVATFIVESEDTPSIQEALSILKAWNLAWRPAFFMCDYANEEINAIETVFPESFVYLCDFHREQSWDRWLKASHNCIGNDKPEILNLFRSIAHANTIEEFNMAKSALEESRFWTNNSRLRSWFKDRWLDKHKRWVKAFRQMRFNASVNTNNGVERQNKSLKYEFLEKKKAKSLSHLLTILWHEFLPDIYQRLKHNQLLAYTFFYILV